MEQTQSDILYRKYDDSETVPQPQEENQQTTLEDNLAVDWMRKFTTWRDRKRIKYEDDWLEDLRAANSIEEADVHSALTKDDPNKSTHYVGITQTKCVQAYSRLTELEFPGPTQKNWNVTPTPVAKLVPSARAVVEKKVQAIAQRLMQEAQKTGQTDIDPALLQEQARQLIQQEARERSERMGSTIEDQLVEANYETKLRHAELERVQCGTFILKAPLVRTVTKHSWMDIPNETGETSWQKMPEEQPTPGLEQPSIFDVYFDDQATEILPTTEVCERHVYNKSQLLELLDYPDFKMEKIAAVLTAYPTGNYTPLDTDLERKQLQNRTSADSIPTTPHWEVIECHGSVTGQDLIDLGIKTFDDSQLEPEHREILRKKQILSEYHCEIWICGHYVVMIRVKPGRPKYNIYMAVPYVKVANQIWGRGVPRMMKCSRSIINAACRAMMNNAGESEKPYTEVNEDVIEVGTKLQQMLKERLIVREGGDMAYPGVRFTNVPSIINECLAIIGFGIRLADDETTIPTIDPMSGGSAATHRTLGGLSMLVGGGNIILKSAVKNGDDYCTKPLIERFWEFNMEWNPDESIKGDMRAEAFGTASLMAKEVAIQNLLQFFGVAQTPTMQHRVNWNNELREFARLCDRDPRTAVKTDTEIEAAENDPIKMAQVKLQLEGLQQQIEETKSRIMLNIAKAESEGGSPEQKQATLVKLFAEVDKLKAETNRIFMEALESGVNSEVKKWGMRYDWEKLKQDAMTIIADIQQNKRVAQIENTKALHMKDTEKSTNPER